MNINSPWYSLECVEPGNHFYVWGRSEGAIITQYFFIPKLGAGKSLRVRQQNEKGVDEGRLRVYKEDGREVADFYCYPEDSTAEDNHPLRLILEETQACDVIITDPYVYKEPSSTGKYNQNRISDAAAEMSYVAGEDKKTVLILWWWFPEKENHGTADADVYATSWDRGKPLVDGMGGFNYSGEGNRMSTNNSSGPTKPEPKLWAKSQEKNRGG